MARTGASRVVGGQVQVEGAEELRKALRHMSADLKDFTKINREASNAVASAAMGKVPVLTGRLRQTIKAGATQKKGYVQAGKSSVPYAGPIHFGWFRRNIDPQPFIYDALDERRDEVLSKYQRQVGELVERVGRETP